MPRDITHLAARIVAEELPADRLAQLVELVQHLVDSGLDTMEAVEEKVDDLAERFPKARVVLLGQGDPEWFLIDVHKGQTRWVKLADSAQPDDWVAPPRLASNAHIPARLTDDDIASLAERGIDTDRYISETEVALDFFDEDPSLLRHLVRAVRDRLDASQPDRNLRVRTHDGARWVILAPDHYEIHRLYPHPVTVDARLKEAVRKLLKTPDDIGVSSADIERRKKTDGVSIPDPEELERLIKRARKSAHTRRKGDVSHLLEYLSIPLDDEPLVEELRKHIYRGITWHDTPEVRRVLEAAIANEPDDVYKTLEHVMWRQRDFLAEWLPDELAEAEGDYRDRLLALREKHLGSR